MIFPLNKKVLLNCSATQCLEHYEHYTEIPLLPHPGAFSCVRKNHQHEGVDLYAQHLDPVFSVKDGIILDIFPFTGEMVGSPWWHNTWSVLVLHGQYVLNYGEITPNSALKVGQSILEGTLIGHIATVLKKNKGRPMNMLHLEMYTPYVKKALPGWSLNTQKPDCLLDPTDLLIHIARENTLLIEALAK